MSALFLLSAGCPSGGHVDHGHGEQPEAGEATRWDAGDTRDPDAASVPHEPLRDASADARDAESGREDASADSPDSGEPDGGDHDREPDASTDAGRVLSCNGRKGGALITMLIGDEQLTVYATNQDFLEDAFLAAAQGTLVNIFFRDLHDGADCDAQWSWHPHPEHMVMSKSASEGCDVLPSQVEADKPTWVEPMTQYCPSKVLVTSFQGPGE